MTRLIFVLASLTAVVAAVAACGGEEEVTPSSSGTPAASLSPQASATLVASVTPAPTSGTLPACPTPDASRTFQYQPITGSETKEHTDTEAGYTVTYPAEWTICKLVDHSGIADFASAVELNDNGGLLRVSVYVYQNPMSLTLEGWIRDHNSIFFERATETRTIAGVPALVAPLNFEGRPAPHAYLQHRGLVVSIGGLTTEDFDAVASQFSVR